MKLSDVTTLGRAVDPRYPTNRAISVLSLAVVVAGTIYRLVSGAAFLDGVLWGAGAGLAAFLAWALGRELDPDNDLSAFGGVGLAVAGLLFFGLPSLMVLFWLLLALRVVNRTTGLPCRPLDSLAVLGLGAWLTWQGDWMAGLMTTIAFLLDGVLAQPQRYHLLLAAASLAMTLALTILQGDRSMEGGPTAPVIVTSLVAAGLFLVVIGTSRRMRAVCDATGDPLNPRRVQAAQLLALLTALLYAWWEGAAGLVALLPLWAAMVGVGLYRLGLLLLARKN